MCKGSCSWINITDTNEVVIETNVHYYTGEDITINFIIRDDDYMSEDVTKLFMAADTAPTEYNYGPNFDYAYLNDNADKIYLWSMDLLDTDSAPEPSAFSLSRNYNYGESCGTVTGVKLHNNEEKKISWIELSVTDIKSEDKEHLYVSYEKQEGKLTDLDGNECQWISNNVWETSVDIKSVLLYQGDSRESELYITLADNVNDWWHHLENEDFIITNNGKPVSNKSKHSMTYGRREGTIGFTCDKIDSTDMNLEIRFNPSSNIKDWAFDDLQEIKYDGEIIILPTFNKDDIKAQYDDTEHKLIITFAENYYLWDYYVPSCGFSIELGVKKYILRGFVNYCEDNVITISLGDDIPDLTGKDITLTYSPTCEDMYDITNREIPSFGPIDVETEPPPHVVG